MKIKLKRWNLYFCRLARRFKISLIKFTHPRKTLN